MGITKIIFTFVFANTLAACASTELGITADNQAQRPTHTSVNLQGTASSLAGDGFLCTLADPHVPANARCQQIANMASRPVMHLTLAESASTEQISERIGHYARTERLPLNTRTALVRWFDLATSASREAQLARSGAMCRNVEHCNLTHSGAPALEDLEEAARLDLAQIRAHSQFSAMFAFLPQAEEWSADAEASAWILLSHRVDTVASARPEVRREALTALVNLVESLRLPQRSGTEPATVNRGAHNSESPLQSDTVVQATRTLIAERLSSITSRIAIPSIRTEAERMIAELRR